MPLEFRIDLLADDPLELRLVYDKAGNTTLQLKLKREIDTAIDPKEPVMSLQEMYKLAHQVFNAYRNALGSNQ